MIINITCPNCGFSKKVSRDKIPEGIKFAKCPSCSNTFELPLINDQYAAPQEDESIDFENSVSTAHEPVTLDEGGYFTVLWKTFAGILFSSGNFFSGKRKEAGLTDSFLFGMLLGSVGAMFGLFWEFLLESQSVSYITRVLPESITSNHIFLGLIILSPVLVLINVLIVTLVLHFFLFVLGGANKGFEGTFRVVLYSNATSIFNLIPYIGGFIAFFWNCVVLVIGLREIHETSTLRALFSLLLPFFLLFILGIVAAIYLASLII